MVSGSSANVASSLKLGYRVLVFTVCLAFKISLFFFLRPGWVFPVPRV